MAGTTKKIVIRKQNIFQSPQIKYNEWNNIKHKINLPASLFQKQNLNECFTNNKKKIIILQKTNNIPQLESVTLTERASAQNVAPYADIEDRSSQCYTKAYFIPKVSSKVETKSKSIPVPTTDIKVISSAGKAQSTLSAFKIEDEQDDESHITITESISIDSLKMEHDYDKPIEYEEEYLEELLEDTGLDSVTEISSHTFDDADFAVSYEQPGVVEVTDVETNPDAYMFEIVSTTESGEDIECRMCNLAFEDQESKEFHVAQEHQFYYECTQCEHKTPNPEAARNHFREMHQNSLTELSRLDAAESVMNEDYIATEVLLEQELTESEVTDNNILREPLECIYCFKKFDHLRLYHKHVAKHEKKQNAARKILSSSHSASSYCDECGIKFDSQREWVQHVLNARRHKDKKRTILNGCRNCGYTFRSPNDLRVHIADQHPSAKQRTSTWTKPRPCDICGEPMATSHAYWAHFRRAHPTDEYPLRPPMKHKCQQCGSAYRCKALLKMHMNKHTGTKHFQCPECDKTFFTNLSLRYHQITHSEMRPFTCDTCGRAFKFKAAMTRHQLVHTGERPFVCGVCGQGFTTMHWTQMHVRKVHNKEEIPYKPRIRKRNKKKHQTAT